MSLTLVEAWTLARDAELLVGESFCRYKLYHTGLCVLANTLLNKEEITRETFLEMVKSIREGVETSPHRKNMFIAPLTK